MEYSFLQNIIEFSIGHEYFPLYTKQAIEIQLDNIRVWMSTCKWVWRKYKHIWSKYVKAKDLLMYYSANPPAENGCPSCLYDLLSSGCNLPFVQSTRHHSPFYETLWNDNMDQHLMFMIKYLPRSLEYNEGILRCRTKITPVYMGFVNPVIPESVAAIVLMRTKNIDTCVQVNGIDIDWEFDLIENIEHERRSIVQFYIDSVRYGI